VKGFSLHCDLRWVWRFEGRGIPDVMYGLVSVVVSLALSQFGSVLSSLA
jgi:hypothetical protein